MTLHDSMPYAILFCATQVTTSLIVTRNRSPKVGESHFSERPAPLPPRVYATDRDTTLNSVVITFSFDTVSEPRQEKKGWHVGKGCLSSVCSFQTPTSIPFSFISVFFSPPFRKENNEDSKKKKNGSKANVDKIFFTAKEKKGKKIS